jgi:hypothetical protein
MCWDQMSFIRSKQKLFEATKILDDPDAKMIEVRYQGRLFFFAVGTLGNPKGTDVRKELEWVFLFTPANIPGFMQIDQFKKLASLVASASVRSLIQEDRTTYVPTVSYGGADIRWEMTQLITNYLDSIEWKGYAFDEGPEVEYCTSPRLAQVRLSLKNAALKTMQIGRIEVVYTELESRGAGFCAVTIDQIQPVGDYKPAAEELDRETETLQNKLKADFAGILKEFIKKKIARSS